MSEARIKMLLVGTVSNVSKTLQLELKRFERELSKIGTIGYFLVESDSTDSTPVILKTLDSKYTNFEFRSLGQLRTQIPDRVERIRYCRNIYVEYIRKNLNIECWDFIVVADLDGMNPQLTTSRFANSISRMKNWDALFANQKHGYYDVFALRSWDWVESDLLKSLREEEAISSNRSGELGLVTYLRNQKRRQDILYSTMRRIPQDSQIIQVESAFGGLGIYKPELFVKCDYSLRVGELPDGSEHVTFHKKCADSGYLLGINPKMINANFNEYNINKHYLIRFLRDLKRFIRRRKAGSHQ